MKTTSIKIFLTSLIVAPIGVFIHELLHILFLELGGVDATLERFSYAKPVNFSYNIEGLSRALEFYNSDSYSLFLASFIPPLFTIIVAYVFLFLFYRYKKELFFAAVVSPLILRLSALTVRFPQFVNGTIASTDEANSAYFLSINPLIIYLPSLVLGFLVISLALKKIKRGKMVYLLSGSLGGFAGYGIVELLFNYCYI